MAVAKVTVATRFEPFHAGYVRELNDDHVGLVVQLIQVEEDQIRSDGRSGMTMYKRCLCTVLQEARQRCFTHVGTAEEAKANFQSRFIAPCTRWTAVTNSKGEKAIGGDACLLLETVFFDGIFQIEIMYKTTVIQRLIGHGRGVVIA